MSGEDKKKIYRSRTKIGKNEHSLPRCIVEQPSLEEEVKNWIIDH
jgi:hypothetical protein